MSVAQQVFANILHGGFGSLVVAHDNPGAYPFFLAALGLSVVLALFNCIRLHRAGPILSQLFALFCIIGALYTLWLVYAWPIDRLPLWHAPASADVWLFVIPARTTYTIISVAIHYVLAFLFGFVFGTLFAYQLGLLTTAENSSNTDSNRSGVVGSVILTPVALIFVGLGETHSLSPYWVTIVDLVAVATVGWSVEYVLNYIGNKALPLTTPTHSGKFRNFVRRRSFNRLTSALAYLLFFVGLLLTAYTHPINHSVIGPLYQLCGLYLGLIWLDSVISGLLGAFRSEKGENDFLSPRRWVFTLPLALAIGFLGASGYLQSWTGSTVIAPDLWAQAGAAAAAYMLFKPLVALARYTAGVRETRDDDSDYRRFFADILKFSFLSQAALNRVPGRASSALLSAPSSSASPTSLLEPSPAPLAPASSGSTPSGPASDGGPAAQEQSSEQLSLQMMYEAQQRTLNRERNRERYLFRELDFRTGLIFLGILIIYHFLALYVNLSGSLNNLLITFVFGLITLIAGILNLLNNKVIRSASPVFLLLIFVISGVAAITALSALIPAVDTLPHAMTFFVIMQQLLIFLTFGQLLYLYQLINATITVEQKDTQPVDNEGMYEFAVALLDVDEYEAAIGAFADALKVDDDNADALYLLGATHKNLSHLDEAERCIMQAIAIAESTGSQYKPNLWAYFDTKGEVCMELEKYIPACDAFEKALEHNVDKPASLVETKKKYAEALRKAGRSADAEKIEAELGKGATKPAPVAAGVPTDSTSS